MPDFFRLHSSGPVEAAVLGELFPGSAFIEGHSPLDRPIATVTSGSKWMDSLRPNLSHLPIIFSERFLAGIREAGLRGYEPIEVRLSITSKRLKSIPRGRYFWILPKGKPLEFRYRVFERVDNRYLLRFETGDASHARVNSPFHEGAFHHIQRIPVKRSWDGADFISLPTPDKTLVFGTFHCSRRLIELIRENQWTNISATPIDSLGVNSKQIIDLPWPPEKWYPDNQPGAGLVIEPPAPKASPATVNLPAETLEESYEESCEKARHELLNPDFALLKRHFKHPVPGALEKLFADKTEILREEFTVLLGRGRKKSRWHVQAYSPIGEDTLIPFEGFENYIEFASDGSEGLYLIDPKETDPEVFFLIMDTGELLELECKLSEFHQAPRRKANRREDSV